MTTADVNNKRTKPQPFKSSAPSSACSQVLTNGNHQEQSPAAAARRLQRFVISLVISTCIFALLTWQSVLHGEVMEQQAVWIDQTTQPLQMKLNPLNASSLVGQSSQQTKQEGKGRYLISQQMQDRRCVSSANARIKALHEEWDDQGIPLLTNVLLVPPERRSDNAGPVVYHYHVFFNLLGRRRKPEKLYYVKQVEWICGYENEKSEPATILGRNGGGDPTGALVILRCPTSFEHAQTAITLQRILLKQPENETTAYDVKDLAVCAKQVDALEARAAAARGAPKIAATTMIWGNATYPLLAQWIAHHRVIGVEHFFVYLQEPFLPGMSKLLPSAPYITYRDFNLDGMPHDRKKGLEVKDFYQPAQMNDAIYRARSWAGGSIFWLFVADIDEYLHPRSADLLAQTLAPYEPEVRAGQYSAIEVKNWYFGSHPNGNDGDPELGLGPPTRYHYPSSRLLPRFQLDYVWSAPKRSVKFAAKVLVHPRHVVYHHMHLVADGAPFGYDYQETREEVESPNRMYIYKPQLRPVMNHALDADTELRMVHFKQPDAGVTKFSGDNNKIKKLMRDASLKDAYSASVLRILAEEFMYEGE